MKHFALFLLLLYGSIFQVAAQRKWELGIAVRSGTYTYASDKTEIFDYIYSERQKNSWGISTSLGGFVQRRVAGWLALSAELDYTLNYYEIQRISGRFAEPIPSNLIRKLNAVESGISAPVQVVLKKSHWSLSIGPTMSYHLKTKVQAYSNEADLSFVEGCDFCQLYYRSELKDLTNFQWLWSGALEYRLGSSTRFGISFLTSFKKRQLVYSDRFLPMHSRWTTTNRLSILPRSLSLSLRHNWLK